MLRNNRKSQVWVSAVLFIALGVIAIALVLAAAIPLVNKIKEKNTILQTKEILIAVDDTVRTVANEGPGSQRQLNPLTIDKGELIVDDLAERILWTMHTEALIMEPDLVIPEGNVYQLLNSSFVVDEYDMQLWVEYNNINITLDSSFANPFKGKYTVVVKHTGVFDTSNSPIIAVKIV